jgi:hypothetical protein
MPRLQLSDQSLAIFDMPVPSVEQLALLPS